MLSFRAVLKAVFLSPMTRVYTDTSKKTGLLRINYWYINIINILRTEKSCQQNLFPFTKAIEARKLNRGTCLRNKQSHRRKSSQGIRTPVVRAIAFHLQKEQVFPQEKEKKQSKTAESPCWASIWLETSKSWITGE